MPEQLTKHPDVTLEVLRSAGAQCGVGAPQAILHACPAERFCKLPGGEICVYGLADAPRMTQLGADDWRGLMQTLGLPAATARPPPPAAASGAEFAFGATALILVGTVFGGWLALRFGHRRPGPP